MSHTLASFELLLGTTAIGQLPGIVDRTGTLFAFVFPALALLLAG